MGPHPPILVGTLGMTDSIILMVLALVVFGPRRLPQIGRQIGKLMYEFRKASNDFKFQMEEELRNAEEADRRKKEEERQRSLATLAATEQASVSADPSPVQSLPSPYPGEGNYPDQYPAEPSSSETKPEESVPRIMPPSTGEPVAAASQGPSYYYSQPANGQDSTDSPETAQPVEPTEPTPSNSENEPEALNHHG